GLPRYRGQGPPGIARAWGLDLDDVGAEVGQHRGGGRPGDPAGAVNDFQASKEALGHGRVSSVLRSPSLTRILPRLAGRRIRCAVTRLHAIGAAPEACCRERCQPWHPTHRLCATDCTILRMLEPSEPCVRLGGVKPKEESDGHARNDDRGPSLPNSWAGQ